MNSILLKTWILTWLVLVSLGATSRAAVTLPPIIADGAVLQQGMEVPIWGTAAPGEVVTVKFRDQHKTATADAGGRWQVKLAPLTASAKSQDLIVSSDHGSPITIHDLLVGEVWICAGQSNMEFGLTGVTNGLLHRAAANDPLIRLFTVPRFGPTQPKRAADNHWHLCNSNTVAYFSAVGYFFGRDLRRATQVPIGLISANVGGSIAERWASPATFESEPAFRSYLTGHQNAIRKYEAALAKYHENEQQLLAAWQVAAEQAKQDGKPAPAKPAPPFDPVYSAPGALYNTMIVPIQPFAIRGVIWYQAESDAPRSEQYQTLFPAMINGWRTAWRQGAPQAFPFLFVQLPGGFGPEIREAQLVSLQHTTNTAMVVLADFYEPTLHPTRKEPVGQRLALAARALAYGEKIEYSGPLYDSMKIDGNRAVLAFKHTGTGLEARGGELKGFTIAGADKKFVTATAKIDGDRVVVSSAEVSEPVAVRYGWTTIPDVTLYNHEGLPASPFRTDSPQGH